MDWISITEKIIFISTSENFIATIHVCSGNIHFFEPSLAFALTSHTNQTNFGWCTEIFIYSFIQSYRNVRILVLISIKFMESIQGKL